MALYVVGGGRVGGTLNIKTYERQNNVNVLKSNMDNKSSANSAMYARLLRQSEHYFQI